MGINLNELNIVPEFSSSDIDCYKLDGGDLVNNYYIVSEEASRNLMNKPEVIGLDVYSSLIKSTSGMLNYLNKQGNISSVSILNILRGALNFPIEEACHQNNINVQDISFLSCERVFDEAGDINGLTVKYEKLDTIPDASLIIGDILASGETLIQCLNKVVDHYAQNNENIKNIILFTIGGTKALPLLENMTNVIREKSPNFEGFIAVFYEGIFSCYEPGDHGISGINRPLIDFIWRDGFISPEFRHQTLSQRDALFEKCIIYDGGARRFNIKEHYEEVLEFWNGILKRADEINMQELLEEKLGHKLPINFEDWRISCNYNMLREATAKDLYQQELSYIDSLKNISLKEIAQQRIKEFSTCLDVLR